MDWLLRLTFSIIVLNARKAQKWMADEFDKVAEVAEADQWSLGKFGVERNQVSQIIQLCRAFVSVFKVHSEELTRRAMILWQDFDLDSAFGPVVAGDITDTIELRANLNQNAVKEWNVKVRIMFDLLSKARAFCFCRHSPRQLFLLKLERIHGICRFPCCLHTRHPSILDHRTRRRVPW